MKEKMRLDSRKLGGYGKECETDVFSLGQKRKNNTGAYKTNKCYVQYIRERGGDIIMKVFPNPKGGSERLSQVGPLLTKFIAEGTFLFADSCRALKAWHQDHPELNLWHFVICHARANEDGFTWYCMLTEEDGVSPEYFTENEDCRIVQVTNVSNFS